MLRYWGILHMGKNTPITNVHGPFIVSTLGTGNSFSRAPENL